MKNKLISKGLVIGTIILLLSATPLIIATNVNENTQPLTVNDFGDNSLGTVEIVHVALYLGFFKNRGMSVKYIPPENNPGYDYYFCEVDGKVRMNFSLTVTHHLNKLMPFLLSRSTWINDLWVGGAIDYFRIENETLCDSEAPVTYYVNMNEDDQIVDLETNGQNVTLQFWLLGMPVCTNSNLVHLFMEIILGKILKQNFLESVGGHIPITIHPVQC